jgi:hypothetical protein
MANDSINILNVSLKILKVSLDMVHIYLVILEARNGHDMRLSRHGNRLSSLGNASL